MKKEKKPSSLGRLMGYAGLTYASWVLFSGRGKRNLDSDGAAAAVKKQLAEKRDRYASEKAYLSLFYGTLF